MNNSVRNNESFNEDFCLHLEMHLSKTFENSNNENYKCFWCDGIAMPFLEKSLTKKYVNDHRKIETIAWIGEDGQDEYKMRIKFGKYSLRRYAKGSSLKDCIPRDDSMNWIEIDPINKIIELSLK